MQDPDRITVKWGDYGIVLREKDGGEHAYLVCKYHALMPVIP